MNEFAIKSIRDMSEKTVLITGGNSGIGLQTALVLAQKGAEVIISCRSQQNADINPKMHSKTIFCECSFGDIHYPCIID